MRFWIEERKRKKEKEGRAHLVACKLRRWSKPMFSVRSGIGRTTEAARQRGGAEPKPGWVVGIGKLKDEIGGREKGMCEKGKEG